MELDYIQELLNKHLTFWFVGIVLYIVGWKVGVLKCNLFISGLILFRIYEKECNFLPLTTGPSLGFWAAVGMNQVYD